jgi:hypothetical protein
LPSNHRFPSRGRNHQINPHASSSIVNSIAAIPAVNPKPKRNPSAMALSRVIVIAQTTRLPLALGFALLDFI